MKPLTLSAMCLCLAATSQAQSLEYTFQGDSAWDRLGHSVAGPGDLNGDGIPDMLVGSPGDGSRQVRAFDGATGGFLWALNGQSAGDGFGDVIDAVGDVDFDSVGDFVVGAPGGGYARLYSGASQTQIHQWNIPVMRVSGVGDVDQDGYGDVAITGGGHLRIYSGTTQGLIHDIVGPTSSFGMTLDGAGDCNGDGAADVIVGDIWQYTGNENGDAWVYSGADGTELHHWAGGDHFHWYGSAVAGIGDVNGDGKDDVCVAAAIEYLFSWDPPYLHVYSGADGSLIHDLEVTENVGLSTASLCRAGDYDGDGVEDFLAGYWGAWVDGYLELFSGATGSRIFAEPVGDVSGQSLEQIGDLDGDGFSEVLFGAEYASPNGQYSGEAYAYDLKCDAPVNYCVGAPNSAGPGATISYTGSVSIPQNNLTLTASGVVPSHAGIFFYGPEAIQVPLGHGYRCVGDGGVGIFRLLPAVVTNGVGEVSRPLDFTQPPLGSGAGQVTAGSTWYFQFWYRDIPAGPPGYNLTDGLAVTFCP